MSLFAPLSNSIALKPRPTAADGMGREIHFAKEEMVWTLAMWCCALHPLSALKKASATIKYRFDTSRRLISD